MYCYSYPLSSGIYRQNGGTSIATIKDIALHAGVSVCTVSRYLNNKINVRPDTRERLERAIKELGYVPNVVAQSLKRNSTDNIAVILPRINTSYYSDMTGGIGWELAKHGYNLFIYEMENLSLPELEVLQMMRENMVAGVISIGMSYDMTFRESLSYLVEWDIPVVYVNRPIPYQGYPLLYPDFLQVGELAARHLISRGKRHLALLQKCASSDSVVQHIQSFQSTVQAEGLDTPVTLETAPGLITSPECLDHLIENDIDGVFVLNELMAAGLIKCLTQRGVRIPGDLAVLGFGNSIIGEITAPELSCVDLQNYELGVHSARLILQQIQGLPIEPVTVLSPSIVQREST